MREKILRWARDRFYSNPKGRYIVLAVLLILSLGSALVSWQGFLMPASAVSTIMSAGALATYLCLDSASYVASLLLASLLRRLMLIRKVDAELDAAINRAEDNVQDLGSEPDVRSQADEFLSDFGNRRPFPRIARVLLQRTIANFLITIFCFAVMTMGIARWYSFNGSRSVPYKHELCLDQGGFLNSILHFAYYHVVIFQSLGDGNHAPETISVQVIATAETFLAFFYMVLIFGGLLSTAMFVQNELTPEKLRDELYQRLMTLFSSKNPITRT